MTLLRKILKRFILGIVGFFIGFVLSIIYGASYSTFEEALGFAPIAGILLGILCFLFGENFLDSIFKGGL